LGNTTVGDLLGETGKTVGKELEKIANESQKLVNGVSERFYAIDPTKSDIPPHVLRRIMRYVLVLVMENRNYLGIIWAVEHDILASEIFFFTKLC
jgi:hypothetical protein